MKKPHVLNHPVLTHKLSVLRDTKTSSFEFRQILVEISAMMAYEATKDLTLESVSISTPLEKTTVKKIADRICIASILRAGEGMIEGFIKALPFASIGHIGIYRDKILNNTVEYYFKLPKNVKGSKIILIDPLLATGDTALAAIDRLKEYEVGPIKFVNILSSPVGVKKILSEHPDVEILTLSIEREVNKDGYLLPGLGDAGDRIFGTI
jgi:uracil phosphoribosyltransferase